MTQGVQAEEVQSSTAALTKGERTRLAMLQAAVDILDEQGPEGLTLQAIGERVDLHPTAVYRHFDSRDHLLAETLGYLIARVSEELTLPEDPRGRIVGVSLALRRMFHRYPGAATIFVTTAGAYAGSAKLQRSVIDALRELGVPEADLAETYQMLESYVVGASLFDFAAAPHHLESRRERHAAAADPALDHLSSPARVDANNEAAFRRGLERLLPEPRKCQGD
jgi:AcrR family transcriptional regulator